MDIFTALYTRRSVRRFTGEAVSDSEVQSLLEAAMAAPSAGNAQPWQFVIVDDKSLLARVPAINPYAAMAPKAPVSIAICGDPAKERYPGYWVQDCSAAAQNMLLAAVGLGLGAVWTGIYPMEDRIKGFQSLLSLPETIIPLALIVLGRPDQTPERKSRFDPARVHRNQWNV